MNIHLALLLTHDADFEKAVTESLKESGAEILITHDVDHALEIGCQRGAELDLAVIDRSDCHAITLLSAIKACRHELPIVVVTSSGSCHCAAIAYANGAAACIAKPISAANLRVVFKQLCQPKLELAIA
jgi:DNA-binding NtrC family response regulator